VLLTKENPIPILINEDDIMILKVNIIYFYGKKTDKKINSD
jgi:hypothetical protein